MWVTVTEAAGILGVSRSWVFKLMADGRLGALPDSRPRLIYREDVERYRDSDRRAAAQAANRRAFRGKMRPYRRDGVPLVTEEAFKEWAPYGYMGVEEEREKIAAWEALFRWDKHDYAKEIDWREETLDEKRALTTRQAAEILGTTLAAVRCLNKRGRLRGIRAGKGGRLLFSREQVEAMAAQREMRKRRSSKSPGEWAHDLLRPYIRTKLEAAPGDRLIAMKEAAAILGVCVSRVSLLVKEGRLFGFQEKPRNSGTRLYLSFNQVTRYATSWDRARRRACGDGTAVAGVHTKPRNPGTPTDREQFLEWRGLVDGGTKNLEINHGEYFSTGQAARELGISRSCVAQLRTRGTLMGYRLRKRSNRKDLFGRPWWFFRKEDVWALKMDGEYRERSQRGKERRRPRGESSDGAMVPADLPGRTGDG